MKKNNNYILKSIILCASLLLIKYLPSYANDFNQPEIIDTNSDKQYYKEVSELVSDQDAYIQNSDNTENYGAARIIVKREEDIDWSKYQGVAVAVNEKEDYSIVQFHNSSQARAAVQDLRGEDAVDYVEPDKMITVDEVKNYTTSASSSDNYNSLGNQSIESSSYAASASASSSYNSWGVEAIGADSYSEYVANKYTSKITVAVVDSGIYKNHSIFSGRLLTGYDFVEGDSNPNDENGHGTHVAGTIVDVTKSNNNIKIMPVRVLDQAGEGYLSTVANGINYAVDKGASVINLSLGGEHSSYVDEAMEYARKKNVVCVVAAGNDGEKIGSSSCPAHCSSAITVGSVDEDMVRSYFSNYGSQLDLVAPGEKITSAYVNGGYITWDGTSMAAPHVSGCVAMVRLVYSGLSAADVQTLIKNNCTDLGNSGTDQYYGAGCINMNNILKLATDCEHEMITYPAKAASFDTDGNIVYYQCSKCGKYYYDASGLREFSYKDSLVKVNKIKQLSLEKSNYTYTGSAIKPGVKVLDSAGNIISSQYYGLSYTNNINPGTATVTVSFKSKYSGSKSLQFTIGKQKLANLKLKQSKFVYNGKTTNLVITCNNVRLIRGTDYLFSSSQSASVGTHIITLSGIGKYSGSYQLKYTIIPAATSFRNINIGSSKSTIIWKKVSGQIDGYEIQYAENPYFKYAKTITIKNKNTVKYKTKKLYENSTYYFRVRTYKKQSGTKYYSKWSSIWCR